MSRVSVTWDFLLSTLFKDAERMQIECAIGALLHDREDGLKRNYLIYGPPATGKSTILRYIQKIFEKDPDVIVIHDFDPRPRLFKEIEANYSGKVIFAATNAYSPHIPEAEGGGNWTRIATRKKSKPLPLNVYNQMCQTLDESIVEIKYDCEVQYIYYMKSYENLMQKLKEFNERKTEE